MHPAALLDRAEPAAAPAERAEGIQAARRPAPSAPRDWTMLPEAAALLADCAARPPALA